MGNASAGEDEMMVHDVLHLPTVENIRDAKVQEICRYIAVHLQEELTYEFIQEQVGVKRHDLVARFREHTGVTLTAYIIRMRLVAVVEKVRGGMKIEKAVNGAGFRTYSHFYKEFVKYFGVSPRTYFQTDK